MKKPFKNPIQPTEKKDGKYPWGFQAPSYNNRTSSSIPAGDYYGSGFRCPIGKMEASGMDKGPIPQTSKCFKPDEVFRSDMEG